MSHHIISYHIFSKTSEDP